jgi:hypothetical protein
MSSIASAVNGVKAALPTAVSLASTIGAAKLLDVTGRVGSVAWKDSAKFAGIYQATQLLIAKLLPAQVSSYLGKTTPVAFAVASGAIAHVAMNRFMTSNLSWKVSAVLTATACVGTYVANQGIVAAASKRSAVA